jgi:gluconokinase
VVIILMGVSGSGKTTVGQRLARALGWSFVEGDDFHPPANVVKMAAGTPLTDDDRMPWLQLLRARIAQALERGENAVLACSALKQSYRMMLTVDPARERWVYLWAPRSPAG